MSATGQSDTRDERIGQLLNAFLERRDAGDAVSESKFLEQHPAFADALREHLSLLRGLAGEARTVSLGRPADDTPPRADAIPGYRILREIHRGGQGVVYEAVQLSTHRTVAVKVLLEGPFASEQSRWRFEREVHLVAALRHPNIVVIHESGIADGRYYFVMEYVRGEPLDTHLRLTRPPVRALIGLFLQVCEAVAYAHRRGVIHRDLKPGNILVAEDGSPCILDFGLAKIVGDLIEASLPGPVSLTGRLMGTVPYMSPEQTTGEHGAVDTRTDVYALGVVLYELLTGTRPYDTGGPDITRALDAIRHVDPPRPSRIRRELSSELDAIVLRAMAKEPDRRYQSAVELAGDLQAWLEGRPITARSDSTFYVLRKLAARHYFHTSVIATLVISIISFASISVHFYLRGSEALEARADSERTATQSAVHLERAGEGAQESMRRLELGWFLSEWRAGSHEQARSIQMHLRPEWPEHAAMGFLLDDGHTVETLRRQIGDTDRPLMHYVVGERLARDGHIEEALAAFERCVDVHGDGWYAELARSRIKVLTAPDEARHHPGSPGGAP